MIALVFRLPTLAGCQHEPAKEAMAPPPAETPGMVRTTTTFDMTQGAQPEDIMEALRQNGRVAIRGNVVFATDSATLSRPGSKPPAASPLRCSRTRP